MSGRPGAVVDAMPLPVPVHDLVNATKRITRAHGKDVRMASEGRYLVFRLPGAVCGCAQCDEEDRTKLAELTGDDLVLLQRIMIVCPDCGDKRCPKATFHGNGCNGT